MKNAFEYNECVARNLTHGKKKLLLIRKNARILQLAMNIASNSGSQSVLLRQAVSATADDLLEIHIFKSCSRPIHSESLGLGPHICTLTTVKAILLPT